MRLMYEDKDWNKWVFDQKHKKGELLCNELEMVKEMDSNRESLTSKPRRHKRFENKSEQHQVDNNFFFRLPHFVMLWKDMTFETKYHVCNNSLNK